MWQRLAGVVVVLLMIKVVQSVLLIVRAEGTGLEFVPSIGTGEGVRTAALWLIAAWLVQRRHVLGWGMALTLVGLSIVTGVQASGTQLWTYFSIAGSGAIGVILVTPGVARLFFERFLNRRPENRDVTKQRDDK